MGIRLRKDYGRKWISIVDDGCNHIHGIPKLWYTYYDKLSVPSAFNTINSVWLWWFSMHRKVSHSRCHIDDIKFNSDLQANWWMRLKSDFDHLFFTYSINLIIFFGLKKISFLNSQSSFKIEWRNWFFFFIGNQWICIYMHNKYKPLPTLLKKYQNNWNVLIQ